MSDGGGDFSQKSKKKFAENKKVSIFAVPFGNEWHLTSLGA